MVDSVINEERERRVRSKKQCKGNERERLSTHIVEDKVLDHNVQDLAITKEDLAEEQLSRQDHVVVIEERVE
jgi:hypothetical protein